MIKSCGCKNVENGHSERKQFFKENPDISIQVEGLIKAEVEPIPEEKEKGLDVREDTLVTVGSETGD